MHLFDSFKIGNHQIKNRIVVPPLSDNQAERSGKASQQQFDNLLRLAKQGAGTIILDSAYICQQGRGLPMQLGISEEEHVPSIRNLTRLIKEDQVFIGIRLSHAGAKTNNKLCGETPIGPSSIHFGKEYDNCREFDEHDVNEVCTFFGHAAERAEEAGLDFIEINASQNLLFDQCLNPDLNKRDDKYGGPLKNRIKILVDTIKTIRKRTSKKLLISVFLSNPLDRQDETEALKDWKDIIKYLTAEKIDFLHLNFNHATTKLSDSEEYVLNFIAKQCSIPIIVEGGIKSTIILKELVGLNKASLYAIDKSLFIRHNWYQFIQKKLTT